MRGDNFRTQSDPIAGSLSFLVRTPATNWFVLEFLDCLRLMNEPDNWTTEGSVTIEQATDAAKWMNIGVGYMIGWIFPCITATVPDNALLCDGATYLKADYPDLYALLDAAYIIDANSFMVPDLRGKTMIGASASHAVGSSGGEENHQLTEAEMPSHIHTTGSSLSSLAVMPGEGPVLTPNPLPAYTGSTGGDGAHNNMQPYHALRYCVIAR